LNDLTISMASHHLTHHHHQDLLPQTATIDPLNRLVQHSHLGLVKYLRHHIPLPHNLTNVFSKHVPTKTNGPPHTVRKPPTCRFNNLVDPTD
jgi:hypothetical protein